MTLQVNKRIDVENAVLGVLNRATDPSITPFVQTWFYTAHKTLQRRNNFRCMEATAFIPLIGPSATNNNLGVNRYPVVPDLKVPRLSYEIDPSTGNIIRFFEETSIETLRQNRWFNSPNSPEWPFGTDSDPNLNLPGQRAVTTKPSKFAIWNDSIEIDPRPGTTDDKKYFQFDYYKWVLTPAETGFDWFTIHAFDYLVYTMLIEAAPHMGGDERVTLWSTLAKKVYDDITAQNTEAINSGELVMRG